MSLLLWEDVYRVVVRVPVDGVTVALAVGIVGMGGDDAARAVDGGVAAERARAGVAVNGLTKRGVRADAGVQAGGTLGEEVCAL